MNMDLWNSLEPELQDIIENKITPEVFAWSAVEVPKDRDESYQEVLDHGMEVVFIDPQERLDFRDACWEMTLEQGYLDIMDLEMIKLADRLRSEPYDQGYFFP
jgi:TRAP-type C4-dicarboxylate transport system substrate-binding protein